PFGGLQPLRVRPQIRELQRIATPELRIVLLEPPLIEQDAQIALRADPEVVAAGRADVQILLQPCAVQDLPAIRTLLEDVGGDLPPLRRLQLLLRLTEPCHPSDPSLLRRDTFDHAERQERREQERTAVAQER